MKNRFIAFIYCGLTGWCLECAYTGFKNLLKGDLRMIGTTSLWMFPIYGMAVFIIPIYENIRELNFLIRGIIYGTLIISMEYITGSLLNLLDCCPWNYNMVATGYDGLIRLDYFPLWMLAGLIFEFILSRKHFKKEKHQEHN